MATPFPLTSGFTNITGPSVVTASIAPTANRLVLLAVSSVNFGSYDTITVTGNGLTWVRIATIDLHPTASHSQIDVFRALGASPTAGTVTIASSPAWKTTFAWSIIEYSGVDSSGVNGSGAIQQVVTNSGASTSPTVTLASFSNANNIPYIAVANRHDTTTITEEAGYTEFHDVTDTNGYSHIEVAGKSENDTLVTFTMGASAPWGMVGIEIKAAESLTLSPSLYADTDTFYAPTVIYNATGSAEILAASLTSGNTSTIVSSVDTASISPAANRLILVSVVNTAFWTAIYPTITGCSLTWVPIETRIFDTSGSNHTVSIFRGMGESPTTGALTINFNGNNQNNIEWSVIEVNGVNTTGTNGSGAVVQSVFGQGQTGLNLLGDLALFESTSNAAFGLAANTGSVITAGSGFTQMHQVAGNPLYTRLQTQLQLNTSYVDASQATSGPWGMIALELRASTQILISDGSLTIVFENPLHMKKSKRMVFQGWASTVLGDNAAGTIFNRGMTAAVLGTGLIKQRSLSRKIPVVVSGVATLLRVFNRVRKLTPIAVSVASYARTAARNRTVAAVAASIKNLFRGGAVNKTMVATAATVPFTKKQIPFINVATPQAATAIITGKRAKLIKAVSTVVRVLKKSIIRRIRATEVNATKQITRVSKSVKAVVSSIAQKVGGFFSTVIIAASSNAAIITPQLLKALTAVSVSVINVFKQNLVKILTAFEYGLSWTVTKISKKIISTPSVSIARLMKLLGYKAKVISTSVSNRVRQVGVARAGISVAALISALDRAKGRVLSTFSVSVSFRKNTYITTKKVLSAGSAGFIKKQLPRIAAAVSSHASLLKKTFAISRMAVSTMVLSLKRDITTVKTAVGVLASSVLKTLAVKKTVVSNAIQSLFTGLLSGKLLRATPTTAIQVAKLLSAKKIAQPIMSAVIVKSLGVLTKAYQAAAVSIARAIAAVRTSIPSSQVDMSRAALLRRPVIASSSVVSALSKAMKAGRTAVVVSAPRMVKLIASTVRAYIAANTRLIGGNLLLLRAISSVAALKSSVIRTVHVVTSSSISVVASLPGRALRAVVSSIAGFGSRTFIKKIKATSIALFIANLLSTLQSSTVGTQFIRLMRRIREIKIK